jgi:flagellar basal-body rod modification protein FlgD
MSVQGVSSSSGTQTTQTTSGSFGAYGSTEFMQMLMAQLTHQNPLEPMDDASMMTQYSQLNSLSELQSIKTTLSQMVSENQTSYAASLIGKTIKATNSSGSTVSGKVDTVTVQDDGAIQLQIGKITVPLANVYEITGG